MCYYDADTATPPQCHYRTCGGQDCLSGCEQCRVCYWRVQVTCELLARVCMLLIGRNARLLTMKLACVLHGCCGARTNAAVGAFRAAMTIVLQHPAAAGGVRSVRYNLLRRCNCTVVEAVRTLVLRCRLPRPFLAGHTKRSLQPYSRAQNM